MLERITREEIIESMQRVPETWADLFIEQRAMIQDLEKELRLCQSRLEVVLRDPDTTRH